MSILHNEIFEQPDAVQRALTGGQDAATHLIAEIQKRDVRFVIIAARGTSDHAATYAQYLFQLVCGIPVGLATPSVHSLYQAPVNYQNTLVIGVSQSGAGTDVNEVIAQARKTGALTAAITNTTDSLLAKTAEYVLFCEAGVEKAVAATKTYTTTLALFALLATRWAGNTELQTKLEQIPDKLEAALRSEKQVIPVAQSLYHAERILSVARGLHLCTASEAALKIAETTYTATQAFSSADLLHGPIASVPALTPCLLFLPRGKTSVMMGEVATKLSARGARVLKFAPMEAHGEAVALVDPGTELFSPLVDIVPAQLLAYNLCIARGLDPDNPVGLTKITITR